MVALNNSFTNKTLAWGISRRGGGDSRRPGGLGIVETLGSCWQLHAVSSGDGLGNRRIFFKTVYTVFRAQQSGLTIKGREKEEKEQGRRKTSHDLSTKSQG